MVTNHDAKILASRSVKKERRVPRLSDTR